ncbi:MAG: 7-cyano-7-deazaguanine synthase QueC [Deltaproteobacteria bacterium]|nr:7-cyano-7-deazaguanine synthase QueC [Deltaproteobacteria bacterium]
MAHHSILILSGGLDSTVSSWIAREQTKPVLALTFDYGQRAVKREIEAAKYQADLMGVSHRIIALPWLSEITKTSLVNQREKIPSLAEEDLDNTDKTFPSAQAVWVPNRNGIFLNIAAAFAESAGAETLVTGFNEEEGITFPDNSTPFVHAANEFFWYSTLSRVKVMSFTVAMNKREIANKAKALGINFEKIWFCYEGGSSPCRQCESCSRSFRAFREIGITI